MNPGTMRGTLRHSLWWLCVPCWLAFFGGELAAQTAPTVVTRTQYYDITGKEARELRTQMNEKRPVDYRGHRVDAYTQWRINWQAVYRPTDNGVIIAGLTMQVQVTYYFPRWTPPTNASPVLVARWNRYVTALAQHENGHKEFGLEAAKELSRRVSALANFPTSAEANDAIQSATDSVVAVYRQREAEYDEKTRHGATQGARFF